MGPTTDPNPKPSYRSPTYLNRVLWYTLVYRYDKEPLEATLAIIDSIAYT